MLAYLRPEWDRACDVCRAWVHQDADDTPPGRRGLPLVYGGQKTARPRHSPPPCYKCVKVPADVREARQAAGRPVHPADAVEPDEWHRRVVERVGEWHAVGRVPAEPWAERWAYLVRPYILAAESKPQRDVAALLGLLLATKR